MFSKVYIICTQCLEVLWYLSDTRQNTALGRWVQASSLGTVLHTQSVPSELHTCALCVHSLPLLQTSTCQLHPSGARPNKDVCLSDSSASSPSPPHRPLSHADSNLSTLQYRWAMLLLPKGLWSSPSRHNPKALAEPLRTSPSCPPQLRSCSLSSPQPNWQA